MSGKTTLSDIEKLISAKAETKHHPANLENKAGDTKDSNASNGIWADTGKSNVDWQAETDAKLLQSRIAFKGQSTSNTKDLNTDQAVFLLTGATGVYHQCIQHVDEYLFRAWFAVVHQDFLDAICLLSC